jgi:hypothetical protein
MSFIMARTSPAATTEPKTPAFQAWHVTKKGDKSFWTNIGVAWHHRDGKGLSLQLSVMPMNGQIVLRELLPKQCFSESACGKSRSASATSFCGFRK